MASIQKKLGAAIVASFVLFGDRILSWYMGLPLWETWSGAGVVGLIMLLFIYCVRRWPNKIRPHRDAIREAIGDIKFSLFAFIFVGISDAFYKLDTFLFSFYMYPRPWIVLGVQAAFLVNIAGLQYDELNFGAKLANLVWKLASNIVWQFLHRPRKVVATVNRPKLASRLERVVTFLAGATYLALTFGPLLLNVPNLISSWLPASPIMQSDILLFCGGPFVAWMFSTSLSTKGDRKTTFILGYAIFLIGFLATLSYQLYVGQLH